MILRLLLFVLLLHSGALRAQDDYTFAISAGPQISHFAQATPGYLSADFHMNHKKSLFVIGYSLPLYQQEFIDNDHITPNKMSVQMLNLAYTYKFIKPVSARKLSIGTSIGYKFGHWRRKDGITSDVFYNTSFTSDTTGLEISHLTISDNRETDQHHFLLGLFGEYPVKQIRLIASLGVGVVFQRSYHFDQETTHYTNGQSTSTRHYKDVTDFQYLSACWHLKLAILVPLSLFRS